MRNGYLIAAAALALTAAACSKNDDVNAADANVDMNADIAVNDMAMNADANAAAPAATADGFVTTIAGSDKFEIESGKLAEANATNPDLKAFGKTLQTDHMKSTGLLKAAAAKASPPVTPPAALPVDLQAKLDALKAAKGAAFDALFLDQQIAGHQQALDTLKSYASGGDQASLKEFATNAQPVVQMHLDKLNGWKK
jgi:putative membrane protein